MRTRNQIDAFPTLQETVIPVDRVIVASANVIDSIGECRSEGNNAVFDAEWRDDLGNKFELQEVRGGKGHESRYRDYFLTVINQFSNEPREFYRYSSMVRRVEACDERWREIKTKRRLEDTELLVESYLERAVEFSLEENQQFLGIMAANEIYDYRLAPKLRRFGSRVLRSLTGS